MKKNRKTKTTTDASEILLRRYGKDRPRIERLLAEERRRLDVAEQIYNARIKANLTQAQLAKLVGTTPSVISRLEDTDYEGHSLSMLKRIADALGKQIKFELV